MSYILQLGKYFTPESGGIEQVTEKLASVFDALEDHKVVCLSSNTSSVNEWGLRGTIYRSKQNVKIFSQGISISYIFQAVMLGWKSKLVIVHYPNVLSLIACIVYALRGIDYILFWHADIVGKPIASRLLSPVIKLSISHSIGVVYTSKRYAKASNYFDYAREKYHVIPLCCDERLENINLNASISNFVKGRKIILSIGRLVPYKGYLDLLKNVSSLKNDVCFIIAGDGPLMAHLRQQVSDMDLQDDVLLIGRISEIEKQMLLSNADCFLMSSVDRSEAFGVVLIEAMSYSLPVICFSIPGSGVAEVNVDKLTGISCKLGDYSALSSAIDQMVSNKRMRKKLSSNARLRYEKNYTHEIFANNVTQLLSSLSLRL